MNELETMVDRRKYIDAAELAREQECPVCPHGYLVHGAKGCWKCRCSVQLTELTAA